MMMGRWIAGLVAWLIDGFTPGPIRPISPPLPPPSLRSRTLAKVDAPPL